MKKIKKVKKITLKPTSDVGFANRHRMSVKVKVKRSKKAEEIKIKIDNLLKKGKARGFVTYSEIIKEFPHIEEDVALLDTIYDTFSESSVDVIESKDRCRPDVSSGNRQNFLD